MQLIHARVSERILHKVDRLFTNRLTQIFVELLQNSRRAGATHVNVTASEKDGKTTIIFHDNGSGIEDFASLLHLGSSDWDANTELREDPAGMGFFSLIHSGVDVASGSKFASITTAHFLGQQGVQVVDSDPVVPGTRLTFVRAESLGTVEHALKEVAKFGPIDVILNGAALIREDFLKDAVKIKIVDEVRIGVFIGYSHPRNKANFHGSVIEIHDSELHIDKVLLPKIVHGDANALHVHFDILETRKIRLKLPDRTALVEDESFKELLRAARIAMFEYLGEQPDHCAQYDLFREAHKYGVDLKESVPWLKPFHVLSANDNEPFDAPTPCRIQFDPALFALVDLNDDTEDHAAFTFELAASNFQKAPRVPLLMDRSFAGYSWYDALPVYRDFALTLGSIPSDEVTYSECLTVVDSIRLSFSLVEKELGKPNGGETNQLFVWDVPFAGWVDDEYEPTIFISRDSTWAKQADQYAEPFSLLHAATHLAFSASDDVEADSHETQLEYFDERIDASLRRVLGGAIAHVRHLLRKAVQDWDMRQALNQAGITEAHFVRNGDTGDWTFVIPAAA